MLPASALKTTFYSINIYSKSKPAVTKELTELISNDKGEVNCLNRVRSDYADFGSNADCLVFGSKSNEGLLFAVRTNKSVDGSGDHVEDFLESFFDLDFVSSVMNEEGKGVPLGHGLVGLFSAEGLDKNGVFIKLGGEFESGFGVIVLGLGGELEGVRFVESEVVSDSVFSSLDALLGGLGGPCSLLNLLGFGGHN